MDLSNFAQMDPNMLVSIVNLKLRNDYSGSLDRLVRSMDLDKSELEEKLKSAGFEYLPDAGQFR